METKAPAVKPAFTLRVKKSREAVDFIEVGLKEIDEQTYIAAQKLIRGGKEIEATKFLINALCITGNAQDITADFQRVLAASNPLADLLTPMDGELKKN